MSFSLSQMLFVRKQSSNQFSDKIIYNGNDHTAHTTDQNAGITP